MSKSVLVWRVDWPLRVLHAELQRMPASSHMRYMQRRICQGSERTAVCEAIWNVQEWTMVRWEHLAVQSMPAELSELHKWHNVLQMWEPFQLPRMKAEVSVDVWPWSFLQWFETSLRQLWFQMLKLLIKRTKLYDLPWWCQAYQLDRRWKFHSLVLPTLSSVLANVSVRRSYRYVCAYHIVHSLHVHSAWQN